MTVASVTLTGDAVQGILPNLTPPAVRAAMSTTVKLGRNRPFGRPQCYDLADYVNLNQVPIPLAVDWYSKAQISISRMYLNDRYGDCVFASKAHGLGIWSANDPDSAGGTTVLCTDKEVEQQYLAYTGGADNGAVISEVLDYMRSPGFIAGGKRYTIDGYVSCDWRSKELTQIGLTLFGCGFIGIDLPSAWTSAAVWDVTNTRSVGGHDVCPCFTGDTKISLLDGTERTLEELASGAAGSEFWVYSCDENGNVVPGRAHSVRKTGINRTLLKVTLDNGEEVRCTPEHRFLLRDGTYREACELSSGDSLMAKAANNHKVVSVEPCGQEDVYDLTVDVHHNFALTAGMFVHNCGYGANVAGFNADGVVISSWGRLYLITWAAWTSTKWLDELDFAVPTFLWTGLDQRAPNGVDLTTLKADLKLIGGGTLPPLPNPTDTIDWTP